MTSSTTVTICQDCENDAVEMFCKDCEDGSQPRYYCTDCAEHHLKKKKYASHNIVSIRCDALDTVRPFVEFVSYLGFSKKFLTEEKMLNIDALEIHNDADTGYNDSYTFQPKELLPMILQKVMACNHHCRQVFLRELKAHEPYPIIYHPMDTLLTLILCCDDIFLQDLFKRLYTCQIAIPLLLPNPHTNRITFPLWAMREIVKQWKYCNAAGEYIPCEGRLVDCEAPIVSFMRFNKAKDLYKSKILNGVISDSKHRYFFDSECSGSDAKRSYVNGLAEISWYLPNGISDSYSTPVAFCNLRGDARNHPVQFKILTVISQVCFLFVRNDDVNELLKEMLCLKSRKSKVYLLMNVCSNMDMISEIPNCDVLLFKNQGPASVIEEIILKINESSLVAPHSSLSSCLNPVNFENSFEIDEKQNQLIFHGKKSTDEFMQFLECQQNDKSITVKQALVPLQGQSLWHEWAKENKKQKRIKLQHIGDMSTQEYHAQQEELKDAIMQKMGKIEYSTAMQKFIDALIFRSPEKEKLRSYFLRWLKLHLDDYSRKTLPNLRKKCETTRARLKNFEDANKTKVNAEKNEVRKLLYRESQDLANASFGLEHFFRELGIIYEIMMVSESKSSLLKSEVVKKFPKAAAEILLDGQPLELLDGDAAHISINWITAILEELKNLIGANSRLFVLSVLGIQSSGKSTLLNTAFGLRFAVSAGRCTRGAFFQLLKCDHTFQGICDYLLVIDTEGLRAPELEYEGTHNHDNELATLVLGLAGLTIINVFGEVSGELDDILQTSVHAFLRMKTKVVLSPSCMFVKHHVDEVTVNKGREGLHKLQEKLDDMTLNAAREEHCEGLYKQFNDVIRFNVEKDVYYFPSLWIDTPPMSPINPKYCEAAQRLKKEIVERMRSKQNVCTLEEFSLRVTRLWEAVLDENFIFSFKNALEIAAFNELDQQSVKWSWDLQNVVKLWEDKTRRALKAGKLESDKYVQNIIKEVEDELDSKHEKIKTGIKELFEEHKSASMLAQWRGGTERNITKYTANHKIKARKFCQNIIEFEKLIKKVRAGYEEKVRQEVKNLVKEMSVNKDTSTEITKEVEDDLHEKFAMKWKQWMEEIEQLVPLPPPTNIEKDILSQIYTHGGVQHLHALISKSVQSDHDTLSFRAKNGHGLLYMLVKKEKHINYVLNIQSFQVEAYSKINKKTDDILEGKKLYLDSISEKEIDYPIEEIQKIVQSIIADIETDEKSYIHDGFSLTAQYRVDVILIVCSYALQVFEKMRERSNDNHPVTYIKSREEMYQRMFISYYKQGVAAKATAHQNACDAASSLSFLVKRSLESECGVQSWLENGLENKLRFTKNFFRCKKALKRAVLLQLLEKSNFSYYQTYLTNVSESYLFWIEEFVNEECGSRLINGKNLIDRTAEEELQKTKCSVRKVVVSIYDNFGLKKWLEIFHERIDLPINERDLMDLVGQHIAEDFDLDLFKSEFLQKLDNDMKDFSKSPEVQSKFNSVKKAVVNKFHEKLAGCSAQCPFCNEQCEFTIPDHLGNHSCEHRPQCFGGYCNKNTDEMILLHCNDAIQKNAKFRCDETNGRLVPYKDYRSYFPDWLIDDSPTHGSRYWQWFVGAFTENIADLLKMKEPIRRETISSWRRLSKADAEKDVKDRYKIYY